MTGRDQAHLDRLFEDFKAQGIPTTERTAIKMPCDFMDPASVEKEFRNVSIFIYAQYQAMMKTGGKLDVLINAAGVVNRKSIKQATVIDWDKSNFKKSFISFSNVNKRKRQSADDQHESRILEGL